MRPKEVIDLLNSLRDPFNTRLDIEICDKNGKILKGGDRPILRFRGGEFGKIRSSIDSVRKTYRGEGDDFCGNTFCAFSLVDAIGYSLRRSGRASEGGRYNPVTGELLPEYNWGFPFLIAIDIRRYLERKRGTSFSIYKPGEISISDPVDLCDIVLLFGPKIKLQNPFDKSIMMNYLGLVNGAYRNQSYIELLQRQHDALLEDAVVEPPELIKED